MPGVAAVSSRNSASCPASSGLRWPPILAGAVLPVWRARRTSLIAAEALTSKRAAASRAEAPASTARTKRRRESCDKGAVISASLPNQQRRSRSPESVQGGDALGPARFPEPHAQQRAERHQQQSAVHQRQQ